MRRPLTVTLIAAIAALLAGCGKSDDTGTKISALEARLDRIEKRLGARGGPPAAFCRPRGGGEEPQGPPPGAGAGTGAGAARGATAPPPPPRPAERATT